MRGSEQIWLPLVNNLGLQISRNISLYLIVPSRRKTSHDLITTLLVGDRDNSVPSSDVSSEAIWLGPAVVPGVRRSGILVVQLWCLSMQDSQSIPSVGGHRPII